MSVVRRSIIAGLFVSLFGAATVGQAATIGFDDVPVGVLLTNFTEDGLSFSVSTVGSESATVFDTTCVGAACNGDEDLVPGSQGENGILGNVLIIQEDGSNIPDDSARGGTIILESLAGNVAFRLTGVSAIDDGTFKVSTRINGTLTLLVQFVLGENETGIAGFNSGLIGVGDAIVIDYSGSGGIDSLGVQAVPLPAAAWLFLSGLAGLFGVKRFRRA